MIREIHYLLQKMESWQMEIPWHGRVALPYLVWKGLFGVGLIWALEGPQIGRIIFPLIILMRIAFHCILRVGEMLALTASDFSFPTLAEDSNPVMVIPIRDSKNKYHCGGAQFSLRRDKATILWSRWLVEGMSAGQNIWELSDSA